MSELSATTEPGYRLEYHVSHEAWYAKVPGGPAREPEIYATVAHPNGEVRELTVVDKTDRIGQRAIQVKVFDESFPVFAEQAHLFTALAEEQPTNLDEVREILDRLGFTDATSRVDPDGRSRDDLARQGAQRLRDEAARLVAEAERLEKP